MAAKKVDMTEKSKEDTDNAREVGGFDSSLAAPAAPLIPRRPKTAAPTRETMEALAAELRDAVRRFDEINREKGDDDGEAF